MHDMLLANVSTVWTWLLLLLSATFGSFGDILLFEWARKRGQWTIFAGLGLWLISLLLFAWLFRYRSLPFSTSVVVFVVIHILIDVTWDVSVFGGRLTGLQFAGIALAIEAAMTSGTPVESLATIQDLHRKAQWRLDLVAAENSMGFHAPQETARLLAESIDYSRQGFAELARNRH